MSNPVVAIGLDAAEPDMLESWVRQGHLPNIAELWQRGAYGRIENFDMYKAELPWTTFLTGVSPQKTQYWTQIAFDPKTYQAQNVGAYDFGEYKPFYALGPSHRVAVFDPPQGRIVDNVNGVQIFGWGSHSAQAPTASSPNNALDTLRAEHGDHPAFDRDHFEVWDKKNLDWLRDAMKEGIRRRSAICRDFLEREKWDLLVTVFGDPHSTGHCHYHLSCPDHPLYDVCHQEGDDPMLEVFQEIDRGIGEMLEVAPEGTRFVLFSVHGTGPNNLDLPSMVFLPELMFRLSFPGRVGLGPGRPGPLSPPELDDRKWEDSVWGGRADANPLRRMVRERFGLRSWRLERFIGSGFGPAHPVRSGSMSWAPPLWYAHLWPQMKAFALPSFSDGYVRVNLQGREEQGIVPAGDYDKVLQEIMDHLRDLRNPRTDRPLVSEIMRTRTKPDESGPDADLVVTWDDTPADVVDSPAFGRIGPLPYRRSGGHTTHGFISLTGEGIPAGRLPEGHSIDVPPTILHAMGAPRPNHLDGQSLLMQYYSPERENEPTR